MVIDTKNATDLRDVIHQAVQALAEGRLVAFPTETVYGLAASALSEVSVNRLLDVKGRPKDRPFTLAIKSADDALDYVPHMPPTARRLTRRCWPGPTTLVFDREPDSLLDMLPEHVQQAVCPNGSVRLRVPAHNLILDVLRMSAGPVVLTSASRSGEKEAITAEEVVQQLEDDVTLVLDDGPCRYGQPSTIARIDSAGINVLREGVFSAQVLKRLSSMVIVFVCTGNTCRSPMAAALCRHVLTKRFDCKPEDVEQHGVVIESAGLAAGSGSQASPEAVDVMREMDIDLSEHSSQPLTLQLLEQADLVLCMTRSHKQALDAQCPELTSRVHLLCRDASDVGDPIGGTVDEYRRCANQIQQQLQQWLDEVEL